MKSRGLEFTEKRDSAPLHMVAAACWRCQQRNQALYSFPSSRAVRGVPLQLLWKRDGGFSLGFPSQKIAGLPLREVFRWGQGGCVGPSQETLPSEE